MLDTKLAQGSLFSHKIVDENWEMMKVVKDKPGVGGLA